jgi:stage II sporulation SpoAA-like protein
MSAEITSNTGGIVTAKIAGKLSHSELVALQKSIVDIISRQGNVRFLVIAEGFQGWEKHGDWEDLSFQMENDPHIEKMAIVGEKKWEDLALVFVAKGFRKFPIEYFQPADLAKARSWLLAE